MRPEVGQVINNKYRLIRLIGDGGMGSVYEARHEVLGTTVALKFLHPELSRRSGLVQRFLQEARVSAHIQSPHVVRVADVDQTSAGLAFMVMEYVRGKSLQTLYEELYRQRTRLAYVDALEYAIQMLEGVDAAHKAGVVHRDLKPDNVMITQGLKGETRIVLLDFGIAKLKVTGELERGLTRPGVMMGTPEYMAPEQVFEADAVDARADIFSLGVMIFEMLAGRRPVGGDEPHSIASAYVAGQIAQLRELVPGIDPALARAVHRAMAPAAGDRFANVGELREAIEPAARAAKVPSLATPAPAATPTPGPVAVDPLAQTAATTGSPVRAIPKTLPPEDEAPAAAQDASARAAGEAAPGTVPGGFEGPALAGTPEPAQDTPEPNPATVPASPAMPATDPGSGPLAPATEAAGPPRPGGTDVSSLAGGLPATVDAGPPTTATSPYGAPQGMGPAPMMMGGPGQPVPETVRRGEGTRNLGLATMLLIAAAVSALVMGGVYVAHEYGKERGETEAPLPTPTIEPVVPTTPTSEPTQDPAATTPIPEPTPTQTVPPTPTTRPTTTTKPTSTATTPTHTTPTHTTPVPTQTTPAPTQTSTTPVFPSGVLVIPTTLPPFFPTPTAKPTQTSTTPTAKPSGRPPFIIIRPGKN